MATSRVIGLFTVQPALNGGYGIFGSGKQTIDGGTPTPFSVLYEVSETAEGAGQKLGEMLAEFEAKLAEEDLPDDTPA